MNVGQKDKAKAESVTMLAYRFHGEPTEEQAILLGQFAGASRFIWNRMLADTETQYKKDKTFNVPQPASYKDVPGLEWLRDMDSMGLSNTRLHLLDAYRRYFKGLSGEGPAFGKPSFKKKHKHVDSYTTNLSNREHPNLRLEGNMLKLPKIKEPIKLTVHRPIKPGGLLKSVTVTHVPAGGWYFALMMEYPKEEYPAPKDPFDEGLTHIGLDMSLPKFYVDSLGNEADFSKPYRAVERRIAKEQRKLTRMQKGSSNYEKQRQYIAKLHAKTKRQRDDMLHKISCKLTNEYDVISIETLDMAAMKRSLNFGKSVSDNGWGSFTRMLEYKAERKGKRVVRVDKWYPSSKTCSKCGYVHKELTLDDRVYTCPICGNVIDRDHQAAINTDTEGLRILRLSYAETA